jgi:hypothetical protein
VTLLGDSIRPYPVDSIRLTGKQATPFREKYPHPRARVSHGTNKGIRLSIAYKHRSMLEMMGLQSEVERFKGDQHWLYYCTPNNVVQLGGGTALRAPSSMMSCSAC